MSGGYFEYQQHRCKEIADSIDRIIARHDSNAPEEGDMSLPVDVIENFKETAYALRRAEEMAARVDYLMSSDDDIASFRERWKEEIRPPYKK